MGPDIPTTVKSKRLVERRREQLVLAAIKLFSEKGFFKSTLRDLSEQSGISYGNIYDYVGSKEDILFLIHEYLCDLVVHELQRSMKGLSDPFEKLRRMVRAEFNVMDNWADAILLIYQEGRIFKKTFMRKFLRKEHLHVNMFDLVLQEGIAQGKLRECNTRLAANIVKCMIDAWVLKRWDLRESATGHEAEKTILEMIFYGLLRENRTPADSLTAPDSLTGKNAIVVNEGAVLGRAICSFLVSQGMRVGCYLTGKDEDIGEYAAGGPEHTYGLNLYRQSEHGPICPKVLRDIEDEFGTIDVYVHDLGIPYPVSEKASPREAAGLDPGGSRSLEANLTSALDLSSYLQGTMSKRTFGRIVYIAPWAWDRFADPMRYEAVKAGAASITLELARELAPYGCNVNCIIPGFIKSPFASQIQKEHTADVVAQLPSGKLGEIDDITETIRFLLSDSSRYITGQVIKVSGGTD
jgi:NAD(P)-dependent dehydrogenase (short-subunit alcohol dehydrogenase family)/AcrR family transcriptional regulator